jgi:hypothetical protein
MVPPSPIVPVTTCTGGVTVPPGTPIVLDTVFPEILLNGNFEATIFCAPLGTFVEIINRLDVELVA